MTQIEHDPLAVEFQQVIEKLGREIGEKAVRSGLEKERRKFEQLAVSAEQTTDAMGSRVETAASSLRGLAESTKQELSSATLTATREIEACLERAAAVLTGLTDSAKKELGYVTEECAEIAERLEQLGDTALSSAAEAKAKAIDARFVESRKAVEAVLARAEASVLDIERRSSALSDSSDRAVHRVGKALDALSTRIVDATSAQAAHGAALKAASGEMRELGVQLQATCNSATAELQERVSEAQAEIVETSERLRPQLLEAVGSAERRANEVAERLGEFEAALRRLQRGLLVLGVPAVVVCVACVVFAVVRGGTQ